MLVKEKRRLNVRKFSFFQRTINVSLYGINDILFVCMLVVLLFKNKIDRYFEKAGYT